MNDKTLNETTSPIEAANGVAKLSGFKRNRCDNNITATNTKSVFKYERENKELQIIVNRFQRTWFSVCVCV